MLTECQTCCCPLCLEITNSLDQGFLNGQTFYYITNSSGPWFWLVEPCSKLLYITPQTHTFVYVCVLLGNHNRFWGTTLFSGRIMFLLISSHFICFVWLYSIRFTSRLTTPLSCYKLTVNHGLLLYFVPLTQSLRADPCGHRGVPVMSRASAYPAVDQCEESRWWVQKAFCSLWSIIQHV